MSPRAHLLLRVAAVAIIAAAWLTPRGAATAKAANPPPPPPSPATAVAAVG